MPEEFQPGTCLARETLVQWFPECGPGVKIFRGCRLVGVERIRVGAHTQVDEGVWIFAGKGVTLGRHVHLAFGSSISGGGGCEIGDFAGIGAGVRILTGTEEVGGGGLTNPTVPAELRSVRREGVRVGAHALVFTGSIVFPGVTVGEGAVVSAGSLVHHDLEPWGIYAGHPLRRVGRRPKSELLERAARLTMAEEGETA